MKQRAPALPNSPELQQLWEAFCSKLAETAQGNLLYTQGVTGSSPVPPTKVHSSYRIVHYRYRRVITLLP